MTLSDKRWDCPAEWYEIAGRRTTQRCQVLMGRNEVMHRLLLREVIVEVYQVTLTTSQDLFLLGWGRTGINKLCERLKR
jgi:hypothetical protein